MPPLRHEALWVGAGIATFMQEKFGNIEADAAGTDDGHARTDHNPVTPHVHTGEHLGVINTIDGRGTRQYAGGQQGFIKVLQLPPRELLINWFKAKGMLSCSVVEGFNNKAKLTMRKSYGFRTFRGLEIALYHSMGGLTVPITTHRFFEESTKETPATISEASSDSKTSRASTAPSLGSFIAQNALALGVGLKSVILEESISDHGCFYD